MADAEFNLATPRACKDGHGAYLAKIFFTDCETTSQIEIERRPPVDISKHLAMVTWDVMQHFETQRRFQVAAFSVLRLCLNGRGKHLVPQGWERPRLERVASIVLATPDTKLLLAADVEKHVDITNALELPLTEEEKNKDVKRYVRAGFKPEDAGDILVAVYGHERFLTFDAFKSGTQGVKAV
ncbi:hypothetical protein EYC58_03355 [Candidatus Saccharibacteria bacterium]|nr:MAG: hypothetical protein EYC58_03355 [Candidatus Saccharibacteria bacterium]